MMGIVFRTYELCTSAKNLFLARSRHPQKADGGQIKNPSFILETWIAPCKYSVASCDLLTSLAAQLVLIFYH
ncbi:MAG: hypothetical protein ABH845_00025, partial [Candidatus Omnitrophota bacterium]